MRKVLILFALAATIASQAFATYIVVMKDGTRYKAKTKWTMQGGKAIIALENGSTMSVDPSLIDAKQSDEISKLGLGDVAIIGQEAAPQKQQSLGSAIKLRKPPAAQQTAPVAAPTPAPPPPVAATAPAPVATSNGVPQEAIDKFERAYENVGIFEHKMSSTGPHTLRADLTADNEDKVFNAISATSFLMVRNAGVPGVQIDMVELFMRTTNGGAAGRFQMTRSDAEALDAKKITQQDYFVRNVIY